MRKLLFFCLFTAIFIQCTSDETLPPKVNPLENELNIVRFDQILFKWDTTKLIQEHSKFSSNYPEFNNLYFNAVMPFSKNNDLQFLYNNINGFVNDTRIKKIHENVNEIYPNFDALNKEFESALAYYQHYFPNRSIPDIYTFISEYAYQTFIFEAKNKDAIAIGLDMFLGQNYPYHEVVPNNPAFSSYLTRTFNNEHIVKKSMETLVSDMLGKPSGTKLIDQMIHNGKMHYILDKILPTKSDTVIMEFTGNQLEWCNDNEMEMWAYLFKNDLFYSTDINKINKLVNASPNTPGMPAQAPGRTANYLGWKIVDAFMKKNPSLTLSDLIELKDGQKILDKSKFKPKRK